MKKLKRQATCSIIIYYYNLYTLYVASCFRTLLNSEKINIPNKLFIDNALLKRFWS